VPPQVAAKAMVTLVKGPLGKPEPVTQTSLEPAVPVDGDVSIASFIAVDGQTGMAATRQIERTSSAPLHVLAILAADAFHRKIVNPAKPATRKTNPLGSGTVEPPEAVKAAAISAALPSTRVLLPFVMVAENAEPIVPVEPLYCVTLSGENVPVKTTFVTGLLVLLKMSSPSKDSPSEFSLK